MEAFGILLSAPLAFVGGLIYRKLLWIAYSHWPWIAPLFLAASYLVFAGIAAEWILLSVYGALGARARIGLVYFPLLSFLFFLGPAALVNLAVLHKGTYPRLRWWLVAPACAVLAFVLFFEVRSVSDTLYGMDSRVGGPYSAADGR